VVWTKPATVAELNTMARQREAIPQQPEARQNESMPKQD
jgi:hypothetical protein